MDFVFRIMYICRLKWRLISKNIKAKNLRNGFGHRFLKCFFLILGVAFLWAGAGASAFGALPGSGDSDDHSCENANSENLNSQDFFDLSFDFSVDPLDKNFPEEVPELPDTPDENENEDKVNDVWDGDGYAFLIADLRPLDSNPDSFLRAIRKRSTRHLFVLYHSWKSFLS